MTQHLPPLAISNIEATLHLRIPPVIQRTGSFFKQSTGVPILFHELPPLVQANGNLPQEASFLCTMATPIIARWVRRVPKLRNRDVELIRGQISDVPIVKQHEGMICPILVFFRPPRLSLSVGQKASMDHTALAMSQARKQVAGFLPQVDFVTQFLRRDLIHEHRPTLPSVLSPGVIHQRKDFHGGRHIVLCDAHFARIT
mmetsp:Transcript_46416/g.101008  ORF Transcript_46416/g.101008 Transcript_46416/m.101008 type:complete len:200 (-) Transcript_46416:15-614(-)